MNTPVKVQLGLEADQVLTDMKNETNEGFTDGHVAKNELLSWIVLEFYKSHFKKCLPKIRDDHFDEVIHLQQRIAKIKEARKKGVPMESSGKMLSTKREKMDQLHTTKKLGTDIEGEMT